MASAICVESIVMLAFTYLSAPKPTDFQTGAVPWLQAHLGTYRFYTLGPIQPNYGSYFGIGQVNINDLPEPKAWTRYIKADLDPNSVPELFSGGTRANQAGPTPSQELSTNLANFEAVGVRYVVELASGNDVLGVPFPLPGAAGMAHRSPTRLPRHLRGDLAAPEPCTPLLARGSAQEPNPCTLRTICSHCGHGAGQLLAHRPGIRRGNGATVPGPSSSFGACSTCPGGRYQAPTNPCGRQGHGRTRRTVPDGHRPGRAHTISTSPISLPTPPSAP